jgi:hypothetical protein
MRPRWVRFLGAGNSGGTFFETDRLAGIAAIATAPSRKLTTAGILGSDHLTVRCCFALGSSCSSGYGFGMEATKSPIELPICDLAPKSRPVTLMDHISDLEQSNDVKL